MKVSRILIALGALLAPTLAAAADLYVGASLSGPTEARVGHEGESPDGSVGFDARAGVGLGRFLGAEVAWHDLGDVTWCRGCADAGGGAGTKVWSAGLTLGRTFGRARPFLKLGWFHAETNGSEQSFTGPRVVAWKDDGAFGEAGVRAFFGGHAGLRLAYERFAFEGPDDGAFTLGAEYRF